MLQGAVPNTYAAAQASMQTWAKRRAPPEEQPKSALDGPLAVCECGQDKRRYALACERCTTLDADLPIEHVMRAVQKAFDQAETLTAAEIIERTSYKFVEHRIRRACNKLVDQKVLIRRPAARRADGTIYQLAA